MIEELPDLVANKIAAGEVIERPASVVKELVENAIDAQATRIEIQLEQGGKKLIRVTDNGIGMDAEDVGMCFHPHATSKLRTSQDLFFITTLGFRGEALPSVGAVAQVRLVSRPAGTASAMAIEVAGGQFSETKPGAAPEGTTVEVRNLFFNTPARQKFLRTPKTELGHVMDVVTRIALPHDPIHFVVSHDGKQLVNAPAVEDRRDRLAAFFGRDLATELLLCQGGEGPLLVEGFLAPPHLSRASRAMQFIFLNRRYIRDRAISAAIREAYQGLMDPRRYPVLFLFLQADPREVDFNVHPTKIEVRFRQGRRVYTSVLGALRASLGAAELAPPLQPSSHVPASWDEARRAASGAPPRRPGAAPGLPFGEAPDHLEDARTTPRRAPEPAPFDVFAPAPARPAFFQVHNAYIIEETPDGFRVTDQHALHERILYEQLRRRSQEAGVESQRLLMPEIVQLDAREAAVAAEVLGQLRALGLEVEEFGENTLAVHAVPRLLGDADCGQLVHDLLTELAADQGAASVDQRRHKLLSTLACKAAVKAGEALSPSEMQALLARRDALGIEADSCPHGRPASLLFSLDDLERQFHRK